MRKSLLDTTSWPSLEFGSTSLVASSSARYSGPSVFLQFVYLLVQILGFLALFLLISLIELITEIIDLAIGLGLSLITSYDASDLLCQFGRMPGRPSIVILGNR